MKIKKDQKQVEAVVNFKRPLFCHEISKLIGDAIIECNRILRGKREKLPFLRRIIKPLDVYLFEDTPHYYFSLDGKTWKPCKEPYILNQEEFPDVIYQTRYLMFIIGLRNIHLYFNVIPGITEEDQFGTEISEKDAVSCITIKANMKSNPYWMKEQAKFLEILIPIIEKLNEKMEGGHQFGDLFF